MAESNTNGPSARTGSKTSESILWFTSVPMILHIIRFANSILLARILEPRDFGIVGIVSIIVYYTNNLSNFGLGNAIVQRKEIGADHMNTFFTFNLAVSLLLCLIFIVSAEKIALFFNIEELVAAITVFSSIFIITSFHTIAYTKLRREQGFKSIALNEATKVFVSIPVSLFLALNGFGYWSLIIAMLTSTLIATITISRRAKITYKFSYTKEAIKDLVNYASWNFVSLQVRLLSEYIDKLIIGKVSGATLLGYYEKSFGIAQMPHEQMASKLGAIAFSTFSGYQSEQDKLRYYFGRNLALLSFLAFPVYLGLLALAKPFVFILLGEKWIPMIPSFQILLIAFLFSSLASLFSTLNVTCGSYKNDTRVRLLCLIIMVPAVILVAKWGIEFVAAAICLHNLLFLGSSICLAQRTLPLKLSGIFSSLFPSLSGAGIMLAVLLLVQKYFLSRPEILTLIALITTGALCYLVWFLVVDFKSLRFLKEKFRVFVGSMFKRRQNNDK